MRYIYLLGLLAGVWFSAYFAGAFEGYQILMSMTGHLESAEQAHRTALGCKIIGLVFIAIILYYNFSRQKRLISQIEKLHMDFDKANDLVTKQD